MLLVLETFVINAQKEKESLMEDAIQLMELVLSHKINLLVAKYVAKKMFVQLAWNQRCYNKKMDA